ncbi:MAG TPA: RNA 2'-phosphotransferase [Allosphingosinicella sp.]|jgi:putative RNA 2'-phosphotransferase
MADDVRYSKRLSLWLRHEPAAGGLSLDESGWTETAQVLAALERVGLGGGEPRLHRVIRENDKQRFELSKDGRRIRARQGHSIAVALDWPETAPPELLFHGTAAKALEGIRADGLKPMARHHVHLSPDEETARKVGSRRGAPVILTVRAAAMAAEGRRFYLTANNVWLTDAVPPEFILGL